MSAADVHGTRSCYVQRGCRCEQCKAANRSYARKQYLCTWPETVAANWVDPTPAVDHLNYLMSNGMGLRRICQDSGLSRSSLMKLDTRARISAQTQARILRVSLDLADGAHVNATGTVRRLQALMAIGHSGAELATLMGWTTQNMWTLVRSKTLVQVRTQRLVAEMYEELWDKPGTNTRARNLAARKGWAVPMAWDDDKIDNPDATAAVPTDKPRTGRPIEYVIEDFRDTFDYHQGDVSLAAHRLGMNPVALTGALYRARRSGIEIEFTMKAVSA
jgi:hypothetical protein